MLLGGVLSDRFSPRDLALVSNVVRCVLSTTVAALVLGARVELWQLAAVGVAFGTVDAVFLPAINTLVPRLVPPARLAAANAVMQGTAQLTGTVGPAVAGFAVALIGVGAAFAFDALTFAVAAVSLWLVHSDTRSGRPTEPPGDAAPDVPAPVAPAITPTDGVAQQSLLRALVAGAREVLGDPVMRSIVIVSTVAEPRLHRAPWWGFRGSSSSISAPARRSWGSCSRPGEPARSAACWWPARCRVRGGSGRSWSA